MCSKACLRNPECQHHLGWGHASQHCTSDQVAQPASAPLAPTGGKAHWGGKGAEMSGGGCSGPSWGWSRQWFPPLDPQPPILGWEKEKQNSWQRLERPMECPLLLRRPRQLQQIPQDRVVAILLRLLLWYLGSLGLVFQLGLPFLL